MQLRLNLLLFNFADVYGWSAEAVRLQNEMLLRALRFTGEGFTASLSSAVVSFDVFVVWNQKKNRRGTTDLSALHDKDGGGPRCCS